MIERTPILNAVTYFIMFLGLLLHPRPVLDDIRGFDAILGTGQYRAVQFRARERICCITCKPPGNGPILARPCSTAFVTSVLVMSGKIVVAALSAFAIVYFRSPLRHVFFWMVFLTLMLPLEVRVIPTYNIAAGCFRAGALAHPDLDRNRTVVAVEPC